MVKTKAVLLKRVEDLVLDPGVEADRTGFLAMGASDTETRSQERPHPDIFIRMPIFQDQRSTFERVRM